MNLDFFFRISQTYRSKNYTITNDLSPVSWNLLIRTQIILHEPYSIPIMCTQVITPKQLTTTTTKTKTHCVINQQQKYDHVWLGMFPTWHPHLWFRSHWTTLLIQLFHTHSLRCTLSLNVNESYVPPTFRINRCPLRGTIYCTKFCI